MKICTRCKIEKDLSFYHKNGNKRGGLRTVCRDCSKIDTLIWRSKNPDKVKTSNNKTKRTIKYRFNRLRQEAQRRNKEFDLTLDQYEFILQFPCYYCNGKFNSQSETGSGLDRANNLKGYIPGNVLSCCTACNRIKGEVLSVEETKAAIEIILNIRGLNE